MAYGFNDDKSKFNLSGLIARGSTSNNIGITVAAGQLFPVNRKISVALDKIIAIDAYLAAIDNPDPSNVYIASCRVYEGEDSTMISAQVMNKSSASVNIATGKIIMRYSYLTI